MTLSLATSDIVPSSRLANRITAALGRIGRKADMWVLLALVAFVNWPLLAGQIRTDLLFSAPAVAAGQWWRLLTWPLVHLSFYHLLLDAGAFWMLYSGLQTGGAAWRLSRLAICTATSLAVGYLLSPDLGRLGLSGLSGIDHGLMAVSALEMIHQRDHRRWAMVSLALVVGKSLVELATGHVIFEWLHMGLCGQPVAACHAGGVLGGFVSYGLWRLHQALRRRFYPTCRF